MKLGTTLTSLGMALSLAACSGMTDSSKDSAEVQENTQANVDNVTYKIHDNYGYTFYVREFTPKSNPNMFCVFNSGEAINCYPKDNTTAPSAP